MLLTLEKRDEPEAPLLYQVKPSAVWMEVDTPTGDRDTFSQRWHYQPGYPAPAYSLNVPQWPARKLPGGEISASKAPAQPVVRVWWSPELREPHGVTLERNHEFADLDDLVNRRIVLNGSQVILESVRVEPHKVEIKGPLGERVALRNVHSCLVVRINTLVGAKNTPVWVRTHGLPIRGQEHQYFSQAGKYTAIFWPVTVSQAKEMLRGLEIISVADFKAQAAANNYYLEMDQLHDPTPGDNRPLPAVDLDSLTAYNLGSDSADWRTAEEKSKKETQVLSPNAVPTEPTLAPAPPEPNTSTSNAPPTEELRLPDVLPPASDVQRGKEKKAGPF
jgi:hypothetical protein